MNLAWLRFSGNSIDHFSGNELTPLPGRICYSSETGTKFPFTWYEIRYHIARKLLNRGVNNIGIEVSIITGSIMAVGEDGEVNMIVPGRGANSVTRYAHICDSVVVKLSFLNILVSFCNMWLYLDLVMKTLMIILRMFIMAAMSSAWIYFDAYIIYICLAAENVAQPPKIVSITRAIAYITRLKENNITLNDVMNIFKNGGHNTSVDALKFGHFIFSDIRVVLRHCLIYEI